MSIPPRDIKVLWAKAAGRCSMEDCRQKLVTEASDSVPTGNILIGQNCHIVAESPNGPRGQSRLPLADRNRYPNLILLCRNHHGIIDDDPDSWPIELLHQIKADHELWVETMLTEVEDTRLQVYSNLIELASECLLFDSWDHFSDHAIRQLLRIDFVEGANVFCPQVNRTVLPGVFPQLEEAIRNLSNRVDEFVRHFMTRAHIRNDRIYAEGKSWKLRGYDSLRWSEEAERSMKWQTQSIQLLFNMVVALNEFAEQVRADIKSDFLLLQGHFVAQDYRGVTNELHPLHYRPSEYIDVDWEDGK